MQILDSEAIVLSSLPFREYDRILTLFAPMGLLKLIVKVKKRDAGTWMALSSPLTHGEFHFTLGRKELHRMTDGTIINQNLGIRSSYAAWQAAEKMIQALLVSQWPGKVSPHLFSLFALILNFLPKSCQPETFASAFFLKIMRHEGLLQLKAPFSVSARFGGECYPKGEEPKGALYFSEEEEAHLTNLATCRSLEQLSLLNLDALAHQKIEALFNQSFNA